MGMSSSDDEDNDQASAPLMLQPPLLKRLKCSCVAFDGLENLRRQHELLNVAIGKIQTSKDIVVAQRQLEKTLHEQMALYNRHVKREFAVARMGCEMIKRFAVDAPPDAPALRTVPYTVETKPAPHVFKLVKANAKRKRAARAAVKQQEDADEDQEDKE